MSKTVLIFVFVVSFVGVLSSQDWRQFRGPTGQGIADAKGIPTEWDETKNVAWKTAVPGRGWSSPVVAHGLVWVTTAVAQGHDASLRLMSFDAASGRAAQDVEVFKLRNAELLNPKNSHASPTPVVDDDRVYVHFGAEGTAALTLDGTIVWKARYSCTTQHGGGGSPVLYADLLIFTCDGADAAFIVALDRKTGKERWKTWRRQPWSQAYTTPLVIRAGDADQIVSPGAYYAVAYEPASGKEIWRVRYDDGFSNVPGPVSGQGLVFITTGFQQPSLLAVRPDGKGDVTRTQVVWRLDRGVPLTSSPIVIGDYLYMVNDTGIASCVEIASGKPVWQQRLPGGYSASPVAAGGLIFFPSEDGSTVVIRAGPSFEAVAVNRLESPILASMAVTAGSIYLRTATALYRIAASRD